MRDRRGGVRRGRRVSAGRIVNQTRRRSGCGRTAAGSRVARSARRPACPCAGDGASMSAMNRARSAGETVLDDEGAERGVGLVVVGREAGHRAVHAEPRRAVGADVHASCGDDLAVPRGRRTDASRRGRSSAGARCPCRAGRRAAGSRDHSSAVAGIDALDGEPAFVCGTAACADERLRRRARSGPARRTARDRARAATLSYSAGRQCGSDCSRNIVIPASRVALENLVDGLGARRGGDAEADRAAEVAPARRRPAQHERAADLAATPTPADAANSGRRRRVQVCPGQRLGRLDRRGRRAARPASCPSAGLGRGHRQLSAMRGEVAREHLHRPPVLVGRAELDHLGARGDRPGRGRAARSRRRPSRRPRRGRRSGR